MACHAGQASETFRHQPDAKVPGATRRTGVARVQVALVLDGKLHGRKGRVERCPQLFATATHGRNLR